MVLWCFHKSWQVREEGKWQEYHFSSKGSGLAPENLVLNLHVLKFFLKALNSHDEHTRHGLKKTTTKSWGGKKTSLDIKYLKLKNGKIKKKKNLLQEDCVDVVWWDLVDSDPDWCNWHIVTSVPHPLQKGKSREKTQTQKPLMCKNQNCSHFGLYSCGLASPILRSWFTKCVFKPDPSLMLCSVWLH